MLEHRPLKMHKHELNVMENHIWTSYNADFGEKIIKNFARAHTNFKRLD